MDAMEKKGLRKILLEQRNTLTPDEVLASSEQVLARIRSLPEWGTAREVLAYWPVRGEVDVRPLIKELWDRGVTVLMPRCRAQAPGEMDICCATCEDDLVPGAFSIMEPDSGRCPPVGECGPDLALIPGVGFDRRGIRLGFGGGYYDRILAEKEFAETVTVGVAYDFQLIETLPDEPWDRPVRIVCTQGETWRP